MKRKLLLVLLATGLTDVALADRRDDVLRTQFRQMAEECQLAIDGVPGYVLPDRAARSVAACYGEKVRVSFQQAKSHRLLSGRFQGDHLILPRLAYGADRKRLLQAALLAEPSLALTAYDSALQGRLAPTLAYQIASQTLPAARTNFARRSIAHGADPAVVSEATAAGK